MTDFDHSSYGVSLRIENANEPLVALMNRKILEAAGELELAILRQLYVERCRHCRPEGEFCLACDGWVPFRTPPEITC